MSVPGQSPAEPTTAEEAVAMAEAGLAFLASADAGSLPTAVQADCLRRLERLESMHTAARSALLYAFHVQGGFEDDGQASARSWLRWQARITTGAAAGATGWMRRLAEHPQVRDVLAAGGISASWARQICDWLRPLPQRFWADAEKILLEAAAAGAQLATLARLAEELHSRCRPRNGPGGGADGGDADNGGSDEDGFAARSLRLDLHFRGAGRLEGDLTPQCAAALVAVLEALGKRTGPEDLRTKRQRDHDALEEACRRLVGSGCLPARAGQPTQIQLHMTLEQLLAMHGRAASGASSTAGSGPGAAQGPGVTGSGAPSAGSSRRDVPAWAPDDSPTGPGVSPTVQGGPFTGQGVPPTGQGVPPTGQGVPATGLDVPPTTRDVPPTGPDVPPSGVAPGSVVGPGSECDATIIPMVSGHVDPEVLARLAAARARERESGQASGGDERTRARDLRAERATREILLRNAVDLLSGPSGLASFLRRGSLSGVAAAVSLPLDVGAATETIPAHLRRAVIARDRHCRFPGCDQPPVGCQPHHIVPRSEGGTTSLSGLLLLCSFHHLVAVHRWGWQVELHPDGTVTATDPYGSRTLHSHDPPTRAA